MPRFDFPVFHPNFEGHQAQAGRRVVTQEDVISVWYGERRFIKNRKKRRGVYLMQGLTPDRRDITVVLRATEDPETWLVHTAWDS